MPVSKSKRNKSRQGVHIRVTPSLLESFRSLYTRAQLAVEVKLPKGTFDIADMRAVAGMFNVASVGFISRTWLNNEELNDFEPDFRAAKDALYALFERGKDEQHWVCKGEELTIIRDVVLTLGDYIEESLKTCPLAFTLEFFAADILTQHLGNKGEITKELIDKTIHRLKHDDTLKMKIKKDALNGKHCLLN